MNWGRAAGGLRGERGFKTAITREDARSIRRGGRRRGLGRREAEVGAVEEGGEFGETEGEAFGGGGAEGDVAQFAAGAGGFYRRGGGGRRGRRGLRTIRGGRRSD